jgi:deoxyribodipyrimidine photolyase-related protein
MTKEVTLVFPHHLFREHPAVSRDRDTVLVEEWLFFSQYRFHRQKLMLHRASMKAYEDSLRGQGFKPLYIEASDARHDVRELVAHLSSAGVKTVHTAEPVDDWLSRRLLSEAERKGIRVVSHPCPMFIEDRKVIDAWFEGRNRYFQTDFYVWQRKKRGILIDAEGKPQGGKWTYDKENRGRYPKGAKAPAIPHIPSDEYMEEAMEYVEARFPDAYGEGRTPFGKGFPWAWKHSDASVMLDDFLATRLPEFGVYEDAMVADEHFLHHSILTPMLNTGLLEAKEVIDRTMLAASGADVPLNSLEGFVRQVLGWREFIRAVYEREGRRQRTRNFWGFKRRIPASFWTGTTGIVPVDAVIRKTLKTGYAHHIERLMVMGNFLLLCEFDPDEVYRWFMEMYIDAYDWVMVPNVYGMTQFADGGLMTTKPYISGSNYLMKMGDWRKADIPATGEPWTDTWDALFWRFMHVHRDFFLSNPRLGMLIGSFDRMPEAKRSQIMATATEYLEHLDRQNGTA